MDVLVCLWMGVLVCLWMDVYEFVDLYVHSCGSVCVYLWICASL